MGRSVDRWVGRSIDGSVDGSVGRVNATVEMDATAGRGGSTARASKEDARDETTMERATRTRTSVSAPAPTDASSSGWTLREASVQATRPRVDRAAMTTRRVMVDASERCADETFGRVETKEGIEREETFARELEEALRGCEDALTAKNAGGEAEANRRWW